MIGAPDGPVRVTRQNPCPRCRRERFCVLLDGGRLLLCTKTEAGSIRPSRDGSGWLHVLQDDPARPRGPRTVKLEAPAPDLRPIVERAIAATPESWLERLANRLGLPAPGGVEALRMLGAHRERPDVAGFPMTRRGRVVGIRYRSTSGSKWARKGGKEGAFVPTGLDPGSPVWIVEGPSDAAALLAIGLQAIGRPSATGHDVVVEAVRTLKPPACVVVADHDVEHDVGQRTADELATRCALLVPSVMIVLPPGDAKDSRDAVRAGARRVDFLAQVAKVQPVRLAVRAIP